MIKAAYIHIPFCEHICNYCDFNKVFLKGQPVEEYLESLAREMKLTIEQYPVKHLDSIFIGGGTPTSLNERQLFTLCKTIKEHLPFNKETEFTFEANPGDLSPEKLKILFEAGVNRISYGVQSFNDDLLERMGRVHRSADVFKSVKLARETGFQNISIDLMYSLPGQDLDDFRKTLTAAFSLDIVHFSGYSLIIEPKTVFYNLMKKGKLPLPGEDAEAEMYETLIEEMPKHGYQQYEISNFALPGYESKHNLTYWNNEQYYGFGAGAHSYLDGVRRSNFGPLKKYMDPLKEERLPLMSEIPLTKVEMMEEEMFLGLRKTSGVSISHFVEKFAENPMKFYKDEIDNLQKKGLLSIVNERILLTKKGLFLGNEVFQSFLKTV